MNLLVRIFRFLSSLELAVFLILALAAALSAGTIYESKYNAAIAGQMVYRSFWMQILLWLFITNLAAVAISRLPWKKHHVGFLVTHLGLIVLLMGAWLTQKRGVDGNMVLAPGESSRQARLDENMLYVFRAVTGKTYELVLEKHLDFDLRKPMLKPVVIEIDAGGKKMPLTVMRYYPKSNREVSAEEIPNNKGVPALKFQLSGSRASFKDWIFLQADTGTTREIGPATVRFIEGKPDFSKVADKALMVLFLEGNRALPPKIAVARKGEKLRNLGRAQAGKVMSLGWMDFQFTLEEFHPSAAPNAVYIPLEKNIPGFDGYQAMEVNLGKENLWLELGASGQVALDDALYYVQFAKRAVDVGFELKLNNFHVGYYEGTTRAKSYSSFVTAQGKDYEISMNEPLRLNGYAFYQASYEMDDEGKPRYSVLSVNYDPGRFVKHLGSLMTVLGIISMFYFKPKYSGSSKWLAKKEKSA